MRQSTPSSLPVGVQVLAAANRTALAVAKVIMIQIMVMQFIRAKELVFFIFFITFRQQSCSLFGPKDLCLVMWPTRAGWEPALDHC